MRKTCLDMVYELARRDKRIFFIGLLNSGVPFACFAFALLSISTGLSAILNATVPLFGALIAWWWLKDRPDTTRMLGLVIGFAGILLLAGEKASFKPGGGGWAVLACLLATLCYGVAGNCAKKYLSGIHPMATAAGSQVGASLALVLPTLWFWPAHNPGLASWMALLVLGVLFTGVAYLLYFRLIEHLGPARAMTVPFLVPVFAVIYGTLLLGEELTLWMLSCGAVVVFGTALAAGVVRFPTRR